jgi:hypothetical protein
MDQPYRVVVGETTGSELSEEAKPAHHYKTWAQAAGLPETFSRMDRLPADLELSDNFPEPLRFEASSKRLIYRGFMSSSSYAFLRTCSKDREFLRALDHLFQATCHLAAAGRKRPGERSWGWLLAVGLAGLAGAAVVAWKLTR